ncbi:MAG: hypothetical protein ACKV19_26105 [Verrucomicrobiales bacterium]
MNESPSVPKSAVVLLLGIASLIWLLNPPGLNLDDTIPLIGNLDEAAAALILINCLKYFGIDLTRLFQAGQRGTSDQSAKPSVNRVVEVESEVMPDRSR